MPVYVLTAELRDRRGNLRAQRRGLFHVLSDEDAAVLLELKGDAALAEAAEDFGEAAVLEDEADCGL